MSGMAYFHIPDEADMARFVTRGITAVSPDGTPVVDGGRFLGVDPHPVHSDTAELRDDLDALTDE